LLKNTGYDLIFIPEKTDNIIDIDIVASSKTVTDSWGENIIYQVVNNISYNGIDITKKIASYNITGLNEKGLKQALSQFFTAPEELIPILH
jgi:hypothetical protein